MRPARILPTIATLAFVATSMIGAAGVVQARVDDADHSGHRAGPTDPGSVEPVRQATAAYHSLTRARRDGYEAFAIPPEVGGTPTDGRGIPGSPTCFDSPDGGMGVHYVQGLDADLDAEHPEALVYEVGRRGHLDLVAVEYIVPVEFVDSKNPPEVLGQTLHKHPYLPVYILHAWVWKTNPDGLFADYNPDVGACTFHTGHGDGRDRAGRFGLIGRIR